jgi:hypothetical protein
VGPTTDLSLFSRPFTDNRIDFEDLIVLASSYQLVSSPAAIVAGAAPARPERGAAEPVSAPPERLALEAPSSVTAGETFTVSVRLEGAGRVQGISTELAWDATVADVVSVASDGWLEAQRGVVLSPKPGAVDAALLGTRSRGITGEGSLATVTFRARSAGDPSVRFGRVLARDAANRPLPPGALVTSGGGVATLGTALLSPSPNPGAGPTTLALSLGEAGSIELSIYSVTGRLVRTLVKGEREAGPHTFTWAGDDDARRPVAPGVYYARLTVRGGPRLTRAFVHL